MVHRCQRTKTELEAICLSALQGRLGLNHVDHVEIGPYSGPNGWTWQLVDASPSGFNLHAKEAAEAVRIFQENFDLKQPPQQGRRPS